MKNQHNDIIVSTKNKRLYYEIDYKKARFNLLLMTILTVVNVFITFNKGNLFFPFSAIIPMIIIDYDTSNIYLFLVAIIIVLYLLCYFLSKKKNGWLILSLILFSIDTIILLIVSFVDFDIYDVVNILFHGLVLYYLIDGVLSRKKLDKLPSEQEIEIMEVNENVSGEESLVPPSPLRQLSEKKGSVLALANYEGMEIIVRKSSELVELVVNGNVYDQTDKGEKEGYSLSTNVNEVNIKAKLIPQGSLAVMNIYANDKLIGQKKRLMQ